MTKINRLITEYPTGIVFQSSWLLTKGYSNALQQRYRKGGWLQQVGHGAMKRVRDDVQYEGGVYALQTQSNSSVHPGAKTALALLGRAHYLEFSAKRVYLFGNGGERLPAWFRKYDWGLSVHFFPTTILPEKLGEVYHDLGAFMIRISGAARAMLECLHLTPGMMTIQECAELMDGLNDLHPAQVQELLEACTSVKVNRLFLFLAERAGHAWFSMLDPNAIDLGKGKRSIVKGGVFVEKYQITVPAELIRNEGEL